MSNASLANKIANQLNRACALEITTTAIEAIEECLGEDMHAEKNLRLTSKIAKRAELERERCAKICADLASEYHDKRLSAGEFKEWDKSREYFIRSATAAECERKIRGEG